MHELLHSDVEVGLWQQLEIAGGVAEVVEDDETTVETTTEETTTEETPEEPEPVQEEEDGTGEDEEFASEDGYAETDDAKEEMPEYRNNGDDAF